MKNSEDKSLISQIPLQPSTLETIDFAMYDFVKNLNIHCATNKGWLPVPIVWAGQERAKLAKDFQNSKDTSGRSLIFPIISIERATLSKNNDSKGKFFANIPPTNDYKGGSITIASRIKPDKTANFANADSLRNKGQINFPTKNKKIVYEIASIPQPVYEELMYKIKIKTEYQQQMNEIVSPFVVKPGSTNRVMIKRDGYSYETYIQPDFEQENNTDDFSEEARKFETTISLKVFGYIIGGDKNEEKPYISIRESAVEIKVQKEHVIFGDINDYGKFRG